MTCKHALFADLRCTSLERKVRKASLTLPGVSAGRVFGATAGVIVDYNTVGNWGDKVYRSIAGDDADPKNKSEPDGPFRPEDFPGPGNGTAVRSHA